MQPTFKGRTGIDRVVHATKYSLAGLRAAWVNESAFRQEALLAAFLIPLSFWLANTWTGFALLAGSVLLVLVVELLNSGIEAVVDRISLEPHELAGRAKDFGSAAVFIALVLCGVVWTAALAARFLD